MLRPPSPFDHAPNPVAHRPSIRARPNARLSHQLVTRALARRNGGAVATPQLVLAGDYDVDGPDSAIELGVDGQPAALALSHGQFLASAWCVAISRLAR